jgi:hypothetical protein
MKLYVNNVRFKDDYIILDGNKESLAFRRNDVIAIDYATSNNKLTNDTKKKISDDYKKNIKWSVQIFAIPLFLYSTNLCLKIFDVITSSLNFGVFGAICLGFSSTILVIHLMSYLAAVIPNLPEIMGIKFLSYSNEYGTTQGIRLILKENKTYWLFGIVNDNNKFLEVINFLDQQINCIDGNIIEIRSRTEYQKIFCYDLSIISKFSKAKFLYYKFKLSDLFYICYNYILMYIIFLNFPLSKLNLALLFTTFIIYTVYTLMFAVAQVNTLINKTFWKFPYENGFELKYSGQYCFNESTKTYDHSKYFHQFDSEFTNNNIFLKLYSKGVYHKIFLNGIIDNTNYSNTRYKLDKNYLDKEGIVILSNEDSLVNLWTTIFGRNTLNIDEKSEYKYCYELYEDDFKKMGIENPFTQIVDLNLMIFTSKYVQKNFK